MTAEEFRAIALSLPEAEEHSHMGHPDFRVRNKVFATLGYPTPDFGMLKLTHEEQTALLKSRPKMFRPAAGAWGKKGSTLVVLPELDTDTASDALQMAWRNKAPKSLLRDHRL